jgi:hypothetical protein
VLRVVSPHREQTVDLPESARSSYQTCCHFLIYLMTGFTYRATGWLSRYRIIGYRGKTDFSGKAMLPGGSL